MAVGSIISLAAGLGSGIYKGIQGFKQKKEAKKINPVRPVYEIPGAMTDQVDLYKGLSNQALLPQQALMENKLNASTSTGIGAIERAGGSAQDVIAGASNLVGNQNRSMSDLAIAGANLQRQAQQLYGNSLGTLAQYQDQKFNINEMVPYLNEVERKEALLAAAHHNITGAFSDVGNAGAEYAKYEQQQQENALAAASIAGDAMGGAGGIAAMASDRRLKRNISRVGQSPSGLGIYSFEYLDSEGMPGVYVGAMADEVEKINKDAVVTRSDGFKAVYYDLIDVDFGLASARN